MKTNTTKHGEKLNQLISLCEKLQQLDKEQLVSLVGEIRTMLQKAKSKLNDEDGARLHIALAEASMRLGKYADALTEFEAGLALCIGFEDKSFKIKAVNGICTLKAIQSDLHAAIEGWQGLLDDVSDVKTKADIYNNLGIAYSMTSRFRMALNCQYECWKIDEELNRETEIAADYFNLATSYMKLKQSDKALELFHKAIESFKAANNLRYLSFAYSNLSMLHLEINQLDTALDYANKSLEIKQKFSNDIEIGNTLGNIGKILCQQKKYDQALDCYHQAQKCFEAGDDKGALSAIKHRFSWLYFETGQKEMAEDYALQAYSIADSIDSQRNKQEAAYFLSVFYAGEKQYKKAYEYSQVHLDTYKKAFDDNPQIMIAKSEADYYRKKTEDQAEIYRIHNIELSEKNRTISIQSTELNKVNNNLEKTNELMRKLFAVIGHDVRGPILTAVQILAMIKSGYFSPQEHDNMLTEVALSMSKTGNLLCDLLSWSRDLNFDISASADVMDIVPIIEDCMKIYKSSAAIKNQNIQFKESESVYAYAEKNVLHTIIRNLVFNAIKFTPERGSIKIRTRTTKKYVYVDIIDSGIGVSEPQIKDIMIGKIEQKEGTCAESGTGFGISLCLNYIKLINGRLKIAPNKKQGSTFSVELLREKPIPANREIE